MYYMNINKAMVCPVADFAEDNLINSQPFSFLKTHILARGIFLILAPTVMITSAVDAIIGLGVGIGAICTLGKHESIVRVADNHLFSSIDLISGPYTCIFKTINPHAEFLKEGLISCDGNGFISNLVIRRLSTSAEESYNSGNFLKRHVASRLIYALLAISCVISRVADAIIGVSAAALSFLTAGKFSSLNNLAFRALQAPAVIRDLFFCIMKFINPEANINPEVHINPDTDFE